MDNNIEPKEGQILFYKTDEGTVNLGVLFLNETVWLSQAQMMELFQSSKANISEHIKHIFEEGELDENSVVRKFRTTAADGKSYNTNYYNLDVVISVGYRVRSKQGTQFRIWATKTVKEFIIKGFVLDDERLKNGELFGKDYFDELLGRIREIRASERRFYQKITDIYSQCSVDYDSSGDISKTFYATVQNKLHWAITGSTAAEIIASRADESKPNMGLTTWKNAPDGKVIKLDITVAKNYLKEKEISELNRLVNMFLDYAELQANKQVPMKMKDWIEKLDGFLKFNEYEVLKNAGTISKKVANEIAESKFKRFRIDQDKNYLSDFDKVVTKYTGKKKY